jgi:hypothetical protein
MNSPQRIPTNKELQAVKDVIASFLVTLKNFGFYPENHAICQRSIANICIRLDAFLNTYDFLKFDIEKERLIYHNEVVFQESPGEENLAFYLYRDGIRWIELKKGVKSKEIKGFITILNCYRTVQEDPEGDLVTALWEAHFPNIRYKASDIYWDSEPLLELNLLSLGDANTDGENLPEEEQENSLSATLQSSEDGLFELNKDEIANLREMIIEEEDRDSVKDLLDLATVLFSTQDNEEDLETLLQFFKNQIEVSLNHKNFQLVHETLKGLHKIRFDLKTVRPWSIPIFNNFFKSISEPQYLSVLSKVLPTLDRADFNRIELLKQILVLLHSNAILAIAPILSQIRFRIVQQQLLEIIEILARRNFKPLEQVLSSNDEHVVGTLVPIVGRISGKKSIRILLKMIHSDFEMVRKQAIQLLIAREMVSFETIFPFIKDSSNSIRQLILEYLNHNKPKNGEALLIEYMKQKQFLVNSDQHIISCYKTLGKCGSSIAIPFLKKNLFKRRWFPDFGWSIHRQGSVAALIALQTNEAKKLLRKASKSFFPNVRRAYKKGLEASDNKISVEIKDEAKIKSSKIERKDIEVFS